MGTSGVILPRSRASRWRTLAVSIAWTLIAIAGLVLQAQSAHNSATFNAFQPYLLVFDVLGVLALSTVMVRRLWVLFREYRAHVPGSRLIARTVAVFGVLVAVPLLIVYGFSLEFLNRGVDSWFPIEVKQGLTDALVLAKDALKTRMQEYSLHTELLARTLSKAPASELQARLDEERRATSGLELTLFGGQGRVIASSLENPLDLPSRPPPDLLRQVSQHRPYMVLEPQADGRYLIRTGAALPDSMGSPDSRYVAGVYRVPAQLAALSEAVQHSYSQYGELAAIRQVVKGQFQLALTLVLLLAMLAAINGAIFIAQRLVRPVQDLIAGTRAVGQGDFGTRLSLAGARDEMGFLIHSFNAMTKRLARAREEATRSQAAVERERERLGVILARLSTGVVAIDRTLTVRMANHAAGAILGADLEEGSGRSLPELAAEHDMLGQFVAAIAVRFAAGREEWREQLDLDSASGRRTLMCACTPLPAQEGERGYVIVFDDITALLDAQRDAAWGEVARRLAHEIKNPLTPIQLSAERLRRRLLPSLNAPDGEMLERSTRTIVQQVETMQQMVNAFSEYARAPEMRITHFDLGALITEVADLYRAKDPRVLIRLELDAQMGLIEADRSRVRQILNNLVTNALEALEGGTAPVLSISTHLESTVDASYAVITVCDNGPGFQRELLSRVFDPYVTSKPRGTGLGLAIIKRIVEEHGGRIDADNRPEGGARVRVVLPVRDSSRAAATGPRERPLAARRDRASSTAPATPATP